jgi:ribosome maturation factor RimP
MSTVEEIENFIRPNLANQQYDLIDIQYRREAGGWVLRLFIDKMHVPVSNGHESIENLLKSEISLDDCEKVSNLVSDLLDSSEFLKDPYTLEVSSPGINRPLKNASDFQKYKGQKIKVSLYAPLLQDSKQKNFSGILIGSDGSSIEVEDIISGKTKIPLESIAKANLNLI